MDAFYAAVEVRENHDLAGKPLIIGHRGRRGVVSTCSYEARRFGVHSAMPSLTAERLCPQAIWLPGRMKLYAQVSRSLRRLFAEVTPVVEPLSIDEAFLDLTGIAAGLDEGRQAARRLKDRIRAVERLTASVGVAPNKFLAKLASDMEKPDGLVLLPREDVPVRLWPLPVKRLWGVGPRMEERLHGLSVRTVGDLLQVQRAVLERRLGSHATDHLLRLARGEDDRPVQVSREVKSISEERTYGEDLTEPDVIDRAILARAEGVARELRRKALMARTVHLKIRTGDFTTWTRAHTLPAPTDLTEILVATARDLLAHRIRLGGRGVRLLGVGVSGLEPAAAVQEILFPDPVEEQARRLARATDAVRARYGEDAVTRARLRRHRSDEEEEDDDSPEASSLPSVD
jgi:nucleotidyltransferase/DNA polymerase involved in DNA repair